MVVVSVLLSSKVSLTQGTQFLTEDHKVSEHILMMWCYEVEVEKL